MTHGEPLADIELTGREAFGKESGVRLVSREEGIVLEEHPEVFSTDWGNRYGVEGRSPPVKTASAGKPRAPTPSDRSATMKHLAGWVSVVLGALCSMRVDIGAVHSASKKSTTASSA